MSTIRDVEKTALLLLLVVVGQVFQSVVSTVEESGLLSDDASVDSCGLLLTRLCRFFGTGSLLGFGTGGGVQSGGDSSPTNPSSRSRTTANNMSGAPVDVSGLM